MPSPYAWNGTNASNVTVITGTSFMYGLLCFPPLIDEGVRGFSENVD